MWGRKETVKETFYHMIYTYIMYTYFVPGKCITVPKSVFKFLKSGEHSGRMVGFQALWASLKEPWLFKLTGRHKDREVFTSQIILTVGRCFLSFSQQGNAFQGPRKADIVAREKVTQLIQFQAERILALKEEITLLRKKGGLILPPIQTPQENRWNPWAF